MSKEIFQAILQNYAENLQQYCATVISTTGSSPASAGQKIVVSSAGKTVGTIGGGALEKMVVTDLLAGKIVQPEVRNYRFNDTIGHAGSLATGMVCGGGADIFIEPLFKQNELYIFGAGHCALELACIMQGLDFQITVLDERQEWLDKHTAADCLIKTDFSSVEQFIRNPENAYIVIMTYGHQYDEKVLEQFLQKKYKYLGMMGSKSKVALLKKNLLADGYDPANIDNLHAPIGLAIGSASPREIAVSIAAELIAVKNR